MKSKGPSASTTPRYLGSFPHQSVTSGKRLWTRNDPLAGTGSSRPTRRPGWLVLQDLVGLAVDLPLVGLGQVALPGLLAGPRLGVARVGLIRHRVLALLREPE